MSSSAVEDRVEAPATHATAIPNPVWSTRLARPEHVTLVYGERAWTAEDLAEAVLRFAGRIQGAGVEPGQRVALLGPATPEWVLSFHALGWLGASVAPLPARATADELAAGLEAIQPTCVLTTPGLDAEIEATARALTPNVHRVDHLPLGVAPPERYWPWEEERLVVLTSGSTGRPRAIPLTTAQLVLSAFGSSIRMGHLPDDAWLCCLPLHHVGGASILVRCALYGTQVRLHTGFDPAAVAKELDEGRVSLASLVPTMLERVLDQRADAPFPARVRALLIGGDALSEGLRERCRGIQAPVAQTWGMTETASQVATRAPGDLSGGRSCGAPLAFARVLPQDDGVLAVSGPLAGGWLTTRDRGSVDLRGEVSVEGRAEDFLTTGGETIGLREIEDTLTMHPAVAEAAVLGVPDPRWGQRPAALVVEAAGQTLPSAEDLRAWCARRLSRFKVPERFVTCGALPRTSLGKLARREAYALLGAEPPAARKPRAVASSTPARTVSAVSASMGPSAWSPPTVDRLLQVVLASCPESAVRGTLEEARALLASDLLGLESELQGLARGYRDAGGESYASAAHLLELEGKRVRPLCALVAARLGGRTLDEGVRQVALAGELVHSATLLHDDVIDEGTERRGKASAPVVYGNSASVLGGDFLFTEALRRVGRLGDTELSQRLLEMIVEMVEAEALQLERRGRLDVSRDAYLRVVAGKTAALFRWVFWSGGRMGGLPEEETATLARAGQALGTAFQVVDDLLDLEGEAAWIGKDALADLRQGKITWPLIVACESDAEVRARLEAVVAGEDVDLQALVERVREVGALEATRAFALDQGRLALEGLGQLREGWPRAVLEAVAHAVMQRTK